MSSYKFRNILILLVVFAFCGAVMVGCCPSKRLVALENQVQELDKKTDQALQDSQAAKAAAAGCSDECQGAVAAAGNAEGAASRAEKAADRAEQAAMNAEDSARKAEAIFLKQMKK